MMQMRRCNWIWIAVVIGSLTGWGCAGSAQKTLTKNQNLLTLKQVKGYVKKVAMVQTPLPVEQIDRHVGDFLFKTLSETIRKESNDLQLLTTKEEGLPDFMAELVLSKGPVDAEALSRMGRSKGFNGLITTALHSVQVVPYKSGFFWFRSTKYRFKFEVTLNLYDPFTGAKIISVLEESATRISESAYEDYKQGALVSIEDMNDALVDLAEAIGEKVAETIAAQPWQASVAETQGARVFLSAGRIAGLRPGQRLAVIEGRRVLDGAQGEKFVVPGTKIDEITISTVNDNSAEAVAGTEGKVKAGDIAIPIK